MKYAVIPDLLWDGTSERTESGLAVIIDGRKIESVCPAGELPRGIKKARFPGCTVIPGLIDGHVHYSSVLGPAFLHAGVTTVRDTGNGLDWILKEKNRNEENPRLAPTIVCCGNMLDGKTAHWPTMGKAHADNDELNNSVQEFISGGVDMIKLYVNLDENMTKVASEESHRLGKKVLAHLGSINWVTAIRTGVDEIEHLSGCEPAWRQTTGEELDFFVSALIDNRISMMPTLVVWDRIARTGEPEIIDDKRRMSMHPQWRKVWDAECVLRSKQNRSYYLQSAEYLRKCLTHIVKNGVMTGLGSDSPCANVLPGFGLHDEIGIYSECGLLPVEILRCATSVNAEIIGLKNRKGRIHAGLDADILLVNGNPLESIADIENVKTVIHEGVIMKPTELLKKNKSLFSKNADGNIYEDLLRWTGL